MRMNTRLPQASEVTTRVGGWLRRTRSRLRGRVRVALSPVLLLLGGMLLVYVGGQYGQMYMEQRRLAEEWRIQQQVRLDGAHQTVAGDGLTRIRAPKIGLDSFVVEGVSNQDLLLGPGHMPDTALPGDPGNAVISGHRDTFFRHIHELDKGDTLIVQRDGKTFTYEVTGKKIVSPSDISVVKPTPGSRMTLITCYPTYFIGPAPKRLVVFSKLVTGKDATRTTESAAGR
jgi:sortase A